MATKTISLKDAAYQRLRNARRYPEESFSEVVMRATWPEATLTGRELLALHVGVAGSPKRSAVAPSTQPSWPGSITTGSGAWNVRSHPSAQRTPMRPCTRKPTCACRHSSVPTSGGPELTLTHAQLPSKRSRTEHRDGWRGCFEMLDRALRPA